MSFESDAELLANAILDNWHDYEDGDYSPRGHGCKFCDCTWSWGSYDEVVHALDCPVLVAKDILTRK